MPPTPADGPPDDLREWVREQATAHGVDVGDLLIQSKRRDAMYKGTDADHAKAAWFADLWEQAVAGRDSDEIHVRGVHYFILELDVSAPTDTSWTTYQNTTTCYNYLESCAKLARILGYIPMDGIVDNKHSQRVVTEYGTHRRRAETVSLPTPTGVRAPDIPDPDAEAQLRFDPDQQSFAEYAAERLADTLVRGLDFDQPSQAPFHLEVWSEKTFPDYIKGVCREYGVNVVVEGEGDLSLTIAHEFSQRVESAGKPAVVLYLSDFDPKGTEMVCNMASKVAWLKHRGDLTHRVAIEQLAVTRDQIERLDLPRKPISESQHTGTGGKSYNTRVTEWEERKGVGATELNALENRPEAFKEILRDGLEPYVDPALADKNSDAREVWREDLRDAVRETLREAGLDDRLGEVQRWLHEFNHAYDQAEPMLESLRQLKTDGALDEWESLVDETIADTEFPVATVPAGDGAFPDDPIYDSDREYTANVSRIDEYQAD